MSITFLPQPMNYNPLTDKEKRIKCFRELYNVFYAFKNCGLTIHQIAKATQDKRGYQNDAPMDILRGNIHKWNRCNAGSTRVVATKTKGSMTKYYLEREFSKQVFGFAEMNFWTPSDLVLKSTYLTTPTKMKRCKDKETSPKPPKPSLRDPRDPTNHKPQNSNPSPIPSDRRQLQIETPSYISIGQDIFNVPIGLMVDSAWRRYVPRNDGGLTTHDLPSFVW